MSEYKYDFDNHWDYMTWDDLSTPRKKDEIYKALLEFAKDIQQLIDDNPSLNEEYCVCCLDEPEVGTTGITCPFHQLPWILKWADELENQVAPKEKD